ncbi:hypothetical protein [Chryseobacterium shigense]|uniref:Peptidase_C39 like family protein n=1 Tax=Chryseobacterium shigense TaxID=297244 RepID=A0A841NHC1_9FLAO|nr:hypothetical protein [Chryseobacterium shigense]MBB6372620.1 hypothetical protein [Chryseobacterium shigense]
MKSLKIMAVSLLIVSLFSCNQDDSLNEQESIRNNEANSLSNKTGLVTNILSAQTASDIPSKFYRVNNAYKTNYTHLLQKSGECSWTNYTLCAGAIARTKGYTYPATYAQITAVKNWCGSSSIITKLQSYCLSNDSGKISCSLDSKSDNSTGRFNFIKSMLNHIDTRQTPFIVISSVPKSTGGRIGHYYTVWSIDWKQGGTGSVVWYTNTLDTATGNFDTQIKSMDLSTFLDNMAPLNPDASNYNALYFW